MYKGKRLAPKRRFFKFTENWEQNDFEDILNSNEGIRRGPFGSALKKEYFVSESNYVVYEQQNAINDHYRVRYYITKQKFNELIRFKVDSGDYIMSGAGTVGRISKVPENVKTGVINQALIRIRINKNILNSEYFLQWMRSPNMQKRLTEANPASAMVNLVPMSEIKKWNVLIPYKMEQTKIGELFKKMDNLINLQQQKITKLKDLKSAYLNDMFPKEGESVPRLRFAGYFDDWNISNINKQSVYRRGSFPQPYGEKKWYDGIDSMPFVQVADVSKNLDIVKSTNQRISLLAQPLSVFVPKGSVLVTLQGSIGRVAITQYDAYVDRTIIIFESFKEKTDITFWAYTMQRIFDVEKKKAPGGTIKTITKEVLSEFVFSLPTYKEQVKIGEFFRNLDNQIKLQEDKQEKLKQMKEAYLNEMFV